MMWTKTMSMSTVFDLDLYYNIDNEWILDFYTKSMRLVQDRLNNTFDPARKCRQWKWFVQRIFTTWMRNVLPSFCSIRRSAVLVREIKLERMDQINKQTMKLFLLNPSLQDRRKKSQVLQWWETFVALQINPSRKQNIWPNKPFEKLYFFLIENALSNNQIILNKFMVHILRRLFW